MSDLNEAARALGRLGGLARARNLTAEQRSTAARKAQRALTRSQTRAERREVGARMNRAKAARKLIVGVSAPEPPA